MNLQATQETVVDRREVARQCTKLAAKFQCLGSYGWTDCEVANISPLGALLHLSSDIDVSRNIRLQIPNDLFEATAELRHQDGCMICVAFTSSRPQAIRRYS